MRERRASSPFSGSPGYKAIVLRKHLPPFFCPPLFFLHSLGWVSGPVSPTNALSTCLVTAHLQVTLRLLMFSWPHILGRCLLRRPWVSLSDTLSLRLPCPFLLLGSFYFGSLRPYLSSCHSFLMVLLFLVCFPSSCTYSHFKKRPSSDGV